MHVILTSISFKGPKGNSLGILLQFVNSEISGLVAQNHEVILTMTPSATPGNSLSISVQELPLLAKWEKSFPNSWEMGLDTTAIHIAQ